MNRGKITHILVVAILLMGAGLALSSCVVYEEPGPYYHGGHDRWR